MKKIKFNLFSLVYIVTLFLLIMDVYRSRTTILTYLHVSSRAIEIWVIGFLIILRTLRKQTPISILYKINTYVVLPLALAFGILFTFWEYHTFPNYIYSKTLIQFTQLIYISVFAAVVWLLNHTDAWFTKNHHRVIFFTSLSYLALAYIVSFFPRDLFARFSKEDSLVENLQFVVLALATYWGFRIAKILHQKHRLFHASVFTLITILLFLATGDEVSWGQRMLNIATPASVAMLNDQKEITIHNLRYFSGYVGLSYMIIGLYGGLMWIIQMIIPYLKKEPMRYYIAPVSCVAFFLSGFAYNYYAVMYIDAPIGLWTESAELMLYTGIMCTMLTLFLNLKNKKGN